MNELGWSSMAERSEMAKLKFFQRLHTLREGRIHSTNGINNGPKRVGATK